MKELQAVQANWLSSDSSSDRDSDSKDSDDDNENDNNDDNNGNDSEAITMIINSFTNNLISTGDRWVCQKLESVILSRMTNGITA